jgi:hypothetical protein
VTIEDLTVESPMSERPHLLTAAKLSPLLVPQLEAAFIVHDRVHETGPAAFDAVAPQIRAIAASGDSQVPGALIARLPALEMISVMGVGYDGVDVAAAKARGVIVTHTPDVLNDDVAGRHPVASIIPPEPQGCDAYGVSRTVVRKAIKSLVAKGLLSTGPKVGTRVLPS